MPSSLFDACDLLLENGRQLTFVPVGEAEAAELYVLEQAAHSHPTAEKTFKDNLRRYHAVAIREGSRCLGFALISLVVGEAELLDIVVEPRTQGQGMGRALLEEVLKQLSGKAERLYLEVRVSNASAFALYENLGFAEFGVRANYYPTANGREDGLLMGLELLASEQF